MAEANDRRATNRVSMTTRLAIALIAITAIVASFGMRRASSPKDVSRNHFRIGSAEYDIVVHRPTSANMLVCVVSHERNVACLQRQSESDTPALTITPELVRTGDETIAFVLLPGRNAVQLAGSIQNTELPILNGLWKLAAFKINASSFACIGVSRLHDRSASQSVRVQLDETTRTQLATTVDVSGGKC